MNTKIFLMNTFWIAMNIFLRAIWWLYCKQFVKKPIFGFIKKKKMVALWELSSLQTLLLSIAYIHNIFYQYTTNYVQWNHKKSSRQNLKRFNLKIDFRRNLFVSLNFVVVGITRLAFDYDNIQIHNSIYINILKNFIKNIFKSPILAQY